METKKVILILSMAIGYGVHLQAMQPIKGMTQKEILGAQLFWNINELIRWPDDVEVRQRIDELIAEGADVDYFKNGGRTALIEAVDSGESDLVEKLIKAGANPNLTGEDITTSPLYEAVTYRKTNIVECLIKAGADVNAPGYEGKLPLLSTGNPAMFKILVEAGANLFLVDPNGWTAIENATIAGLDSLRMVLNKLTKLGRDEKVAVQGWVYANKALQKEGKVYLLKDPKTLVAKDIIGLAVPALLRDRVVRAGGEKALEGLRHRETIGMGKPEMLHLLEKYLDLTFLKQRALEQVGPIK